MASNQSIDQRFSQDYELIAATFHESGHTIIGLLNFIRIDAVVVSVSNPNEVGLTHYEVFDPAFEDDEAINILLLLSEINLYYAGLTAERIYYKEICGSDRFPMTLKGGCSEDIEKAAAIIKKNNLAPPGQKRSQFKQKLMKAIRKQLEENWDAVKLIAHALYAKKRLDYEALRELLTKKTEVEHRPFWKERFRELAILFGTEKGGLDIETVRKILIHP